MACDPSAPAPGCSSFSHDFGTQTVTSGQEIGSLCQSWTLNNPTEWWVSSVHLTNGGAYHHSNWFYVPNTDFMVPDGAWDCAANKFDEVTAAVAGGVLYAQSTQAKDETQAFPPGVALRVPPYARIIASTHLLNVTPATITTDLSVTINTIAASAVTVKLTPFRLTYHDLHIPAQAQADFTSSCDLKTATPTTGSPYSMKLYYALPHYHKLGTLFNLTALGGPTDGMMLDSLAGFDSEAHGKVFDPPVDMTAGNGFTFTCGYQNPTTSPVGWGIGTQEMCEMLGFADSAYAYDATVNDGTNVVGATQNGVVMNTGPCSVIAIPWTQDKPGGMPPM
jgi:hypothetical protein